MYLYIQYSTVHLLNTMMHKVLGLHLFERWFSGVCEVRVVSDKPLGNPVLVSNT